MDLEKEIRAQAIYSGHVQGVGFRWRCRECARDFEVTGWVRNIADGTVHLEAQGEATEVDRFLAEVSRQLDGLIDAVERTGIPLQPDGTGFVIRA